MLGRINRFHGHNSLNFAYKHGKTVRGDLFGLRVSDNSRRTSYRAAVVVSKKVAKLAVTRNRIRRKIFAELRNYAGQITQPIDIIITVFKAEVKDIPAAELSAELQKLLLKAKVIAKTTTKPRDTIEPKES